MSAESTVDVEETVHLSTSDLLLGLGAQIDADEIQIGQLIDVLRDRAFGFILLILALPCAVPFLYGIPQAVSVPLVFVAGQIAIGRHKLWMPEKVRARSFSREAFEDMAQKAAPYIRWFEKISKPRLIALTRGPIERVLGVLLLIFSASIAMPLPLTNTVPGIAVGIMALGFIQRDGFLIIIGTILGTIWVSLLLGAVILFGAAAEGVIREFISGLLGR